MFGKKDDTTDQPATTRAERLQAALDPAFVNRQWSPHDQGPAARQRDVARAYEQIRLTEQLVAEQVETNRLLGELLRAQTGQPAGA